jgi:penicillin-binding protein 1A
MNYSKSGVIARRRQLNSYGGKIVRKIILLVIKVVIAAFIGLGVCLAAGGIGLFTSVLAGTPVIHISDIIANGQATIVYDAMGNEFDHYVGRDANRIEVTWDGIPEQLGLAFVACEDERFFQHNGVDYKGMVRAGYEFLRSHGDETQGASTITQQLLKNTVFTEWTEEGDNMIKKIKRKIQEQYLAIEVTKSTTKDEVLLRYLNAINMGQNTLAVESASQRYFGKSAIDLNRSE